MNDEQRREKGLGRRGLVLTLSIAAVLLMLAAIGSVAGGWWKVRQPIVDAKPAGPEVRAYFGDLRDGATIDRWKIVHVFDVRYGAIPVVMASQDGQRFQIDLLRRDPNGPTGVAETNVLSLFISNAGDGGLATPEEQGQGIQALAIALKQRETDGAKPPALATMTERMSTSATRRFDVPLQ